MIFNSTVNAHELLQNFTLGNENESFPFKKEGSRGIFLQGA